MTIPVDNPMSYFGRACRMMYFITIPSAIALTAVIFNVAEHPGNCHDFSSLVTFIPVRSGLCSLLLNTSVSIYFSLIAIVTIGFIVMTLLRHGKLARGKEMYGIAGIVGFAIISYYFVAVEPQLIIIGGVRHDLSTVLEIALSAVFIPLVSVIAVFPITK